jgi:hypothetical protein
MALAQKSLGAFFSVNELLGAFGEGFLWLEVIFRYFFTANFIFFKFFSKT